MPAHIMTVKYCSCFILTAALTTIGLLSPSTAMTPAQSAVLAYSQFRVNALDLYFSGMWEDEDLNAIRPIDEEIDAAEESGEQDTQKQDNQDSNLLQNFND